MEVHAMYGEWIIKGFQQAAREIAEEDALKQGHTTQRSLPCLDCGEMVPQCSSPQEGLYLRVSRCPTCYGDDNRMHWCDLCTQHVYGRITHLVEQHGFTLKAACVTAKEMAYRVR